MVVPATGNATQKMLFFFRGKSSKMEINFFKPISVANLGVENRLKSYVRLNTDNHDFKVMMMSSN